MIARKTAYLTKSHIGSYKDLPKCWRADFSSSPPSPLLCSVSSWPRHCPAIFPTRLKRKRGVRRHSWTNATSRNSGRGLKTWKTWTKSHRDSKTPSSLATVHRMMTACLMKMTKTPTRELKRKPVHDRETMAGNRPDRNRRRKEDVLVQRQSRQTEAERLRGIADDVGDRGAEFRASSVSRNRFSCRVVDRSGRELPPASSNIDALIRKIERDIYFRYWTGRR